LWACIFAPAHVWISVKGESFSTTLHTPTL
jgi:hypothetical protein